MNNSSYDPSWMRYALERIRTLVDGPREKMSEQQLSVYTFAQNAIAGGERVIRIFERGPGVWLCRVCLAEWNVLSGPDHVYGCPES